MGLANGLTWVFYRLQPPEFFLVGSAVGGLVGVWLARRMGWRSSWVSGFVAGLCADMFFFIALSGFDPNAMVDVMKVL